MYKDDPWDRFATHVFGLGILCVGVVFDMLGGIVANLPIGGMAYIFAFFVYLMGGLLFLRGNKIGNMGALGLVYWGVLSNIGNFLSGAVILNQTPKNMPLAILALGTAVVSLVLQSKTEFGDINQDLGGKLTRLLIGLGLLGLLFQAYPAIGMILLVLAFALSEILGFVFQDFLASLFGAKVLMSESKRNRMLLAEYFAFAPATVIFLVFLNQQGGHVALAVTLGHAALTVGSVVLLPLLFGKSPSTHDVWAAIMAVASYFMLQASF